MFSIKKILSNVSQTLSLSDVEKAQARANIGVSDSGNAYLFENYIHNMSDKVVDNSWRKVGSVTIGNAFWRVPRGVLRLWINWTQLLEWKVAGLTPNDKLMAALVPSADAVPRSHASTDTQVTIDGTDTWATNVYNSTLTSALIPTSPYTLHDFTILDYVDSITFDVYLKFDTNGSTMTLPGITTSGSSSGEIQMMSLLREVLDNNLPAALQAYVAVGVRAEIVQ